MRTWTVLALFVAVAACSTAQTPAPPAGPALSMGEILQASPASDWRAVAPENTMVMELPRGRVVIELAPHYAPNHVANIRALIAARFFDGASIVRSQDNYVVQWGRPEEDPAPLGSAQAALTPEFARPITSSVPFTRLPDSDTYASEVGFSDGFPVARERGLGLTWMAHCYGMVGAGRGEPDSGNGGELYVVIGQAPRHLDRNVTLLGRVLQGMELLSVMPRGTGDLGFYVTPAERTAIRSVRLGSELPASQRINLETLRTDSATFEAMVASRRTRRESFFIEPTGHINLCNVPLPVRVRGG